MNADKIKTGIYWVIVIAVGVTVGGIMSNYVSAKMAHIPAGDGVVPATATA